MHCLETRYQRDWADRNFPDGMVPFLKDIGLLSPRLTLAHCTWARPDELELIAEAGTTIAVNSGSNLGIRSGIAPMAEMVARGCKVALGLDGLTLNEDDDALCEMRLTNALHRGWGFDSAIDEKRMLRIALAEGRASVTGSAEGGFIQAIRANPRVALMYRDEDAKATYQFQGRARVTAVPSERQRIFERAPAVEQAHDFAMLGVAVVVDLDRVEGYAGLGPQGQVDPIRMLREAAANP